MRHVYQILKLAAIMICLLTAAWWGAFHNTSPCSGAAPSYEMQTTPANGIITIERRPVLKWLVFPNGNQIKDAKLLLDGQIVSLQQISTDKAVTLLHQPTTDLTPGNHTMEYSLTIAGFRPITLASSFVIADHGPDLYNGKDRLKLMTMEAEALARLNTYRQTLGLRALQKNDKLSLSAQAHANYQTLNHVQGHYEQQGTSGFTGVKPQNRGDFFGYTGLVGEGISFTQPVDSIGIDRLMDAPYHRLGHINPNYSEAGIAFGWHPESTVIDYGATKISHDNRVMLYPYPGQTDAKISWFVAETPNPLARYSQDKITVGYPISLSAYGDKIIEFKTLSATLTDTEGHPIPFYLVDSSQETDQKCHVFLIPIQPLTAGKTYTVTINGTLLQKDGATIALNRTWSFSTLAQLTIRHLGIITLGNGEYVEVITKNGDLPDLNYTLSRNGKKMRWYVGQEKQYYAYDESSLENGEYSIEISSQSFLQKLNYTLLISGSKEDRKVTIIK